MSQDKEIFRELAKEYAEFALSEHCLGMPERYRKLNSLEIVRPPVLVFEVPWTELFFYEELGLRCEDAQYRSLEWDMRSALFQKKYFLGDYAVHPYFRVPIFLEQSGFGLTMQEETRPSGAIQSHAYMDVLPDEESLEQICLPEIDFDPEDAREDLEFCAEAFAGILPAKKAGASTYFPMWDYIPRFHGVENSLIDLYDRPEFMHKMIDKFTRIFEHTLDRYEALNVLDTDPYYLHCTPACTYELPMKDMDTENITTKNVWCRSMAQLLGAVSPEMLDEFDLQYVQRLFDRCGLSYYGCCEPLDNKIEKLRRFQNLRRVSITTWANVDNAAEQIQGDYVLSYKSNPAFVASGKLDTASVEAETRRVLEACRRSGTPCEFVLKDISTVHNNAAVLTQWCDTVNRVIDEYFM